MQLFLPIILGTLGLTVSAGRSHHGLSLSPVGKINLPLDLPSVSYKGKIFSYHNQPILSKTNSRPLRDFVLDTDVVRKLEQDFTEHFSEMIMDKFTKQMKSGIPSMLIPSMDPLRLKPIVVEPRIGGSPFELTLSDVEVSGLSDMQIQDIRPRLNVLKLRISVLFPKVTVGSQFHLNGTVFDVIKVAGNGRSEMDFYDVMMRTQLSLAHVNNTLQIDRSDPPMIEYHSASIRLIKHSKSADSEEDIVKPDNAQEAAPLLFWILADHVAQEVDRYLLKYINNQLLHFSVPEDFTPMVTWLMNRQSFGVSSQHPLHPMSRLSPFPFLSNFFSHISNNLRPNMHHQHAEGGVNKIPSIRINL